jgi:hypothetical protein
MKTPLPRARKIGNAGNSRAGEGGHCQIAGKKAIRQRVRFSDEKSSANRAGCRYET